MTNKQTPPKPDPALKGLEPFIGTWSIKGRMLDAEDEGIRGQVTIEWILGRVFLATRRDRLHGSADP